MFILFILLLLGQGNILFTQDFQAKNYSKLIGMDGFKDELLTMHFKLYQGYVDNTNLLLTSLKEMSPKTAEEKARFGALKRRLGWEFDGMRLHELYFDNLGGGGALDPASKLAKLINKDFGSYENWKADFIATGMMRGIGWSVLYLDPVSGRLLNVWINEHDLGHLAGGTPLLVMDVFEHAYMPQFGLDRAGYIDAFFKNISWDVVSNRLPSAAEVPMTAKQ